MKPSRRDRPLYSRDVLIQGDSVRMTWAPAEPPQEVRKPIRRDALPFTPAMDRTDDPLRLRLGEELEYARRMLDVTGDELCADPVAVARHGVAMQSLDIVGQMLGHIANVIRSKDPAAAVRSIGMCDLRKRLSRSGTL